MAQPGNAGPRVAPQNDLYTVLLITAAALMLGGTIYLVVRTSQLFGTLWPPAGG